MRDFEFLTPVGLREAALLLYKYREQGIMVKAGGVDLVDLMKEGIASPAALLNIIPNLRLIMFGALIIFFLVVEPEGLNRLWRNIRNYFRLWPFAY